MPPTPVCSMRVSPHSVRLSCSRRMSSLSRACCLDTSCVVLIGAMRGPAVRGHPQRAGLEVEKSCYAASGSEIPVCAHCRTAARLLPPVVQENAGHGCRGDGSANRYRHPIGLDPSVVSVPRLARPADHAAVRDGLLQRPYQLPGQGIAPATAGARPCCEKWRACWSRRMGTC